MSLIKDITTVRLNGVNVQFINDTTSLADMTAAEERFIEPILRKELYTTLLTEVDAEDTEYDELIAKVQRALAPLAYWFDLPNIQAQITDRGTATFTSENMQPLHRWEYDELRENLAEKGCFALEKLLQYLNENKDDYAWELPTDYKTIFLTGTQFASFFPIYQPFRTFESLRPVIKQIEDQFIRPTIGDAFFESLRDKTEPTAEEAKAISFIRAATANLTIKTATEILPVRISVNGFTVTLLDAYDKSSQGHAQAPDTQMSALRQSTQRTGELYLLKLTNYLNTTASDTIFSTYKNSSYYTAPSTTFINPNASRTGIFGL